MALKGIRTSWFYNYRYLYTGGNYGKVSYVSKNFPIFSLKMGELFAHFEKKMENFGKHTKFSRDFSQCSDKELNSDMIMWLTPPFTWGLM